MHIRPISQGVVFGIVGRSYKCFWEENSRLSAKSFYCLAWKTSIVLVVSAFNMCVSSLMDFIAFTDDSKASYRRFVFIRFLEDSSYIRVLRSLKTVPLNALASDVHAGNINETNSKFRF